jgi:hypothetical protein
MMYRSKHLTIYTFLIGCLIFSLCTNVLFYGRILILQDFLKGSNPWVSIEELNSLRKEIDKLSNVEYDNQETNVQYDVKTKQPITNDLIVPN